MKRYFYFYLAILFISCQKEDIPQIKEIPSGIQGYRVNSNARSLGTEYWKNTGVMPDIIAGVFHPATTKGGGLVYLGQNLGGLSCGDFNDDGWIDVFNPGWRQSGPRESFSFLVWNSQTGSFDPKNLFTNITDPYFFSNVNKTIPVYFNDDNYVDLILFDNGDEGTPRGPYQPIRIALSNGSGKYEIKDIETESPLLNHENGDVGDLNEDGIFDLVINTGDKMFIFWGIKNFPYFSKTEYAIFDSNPAYPNNNGFGESATKCASGYDSKIADLNEDGKNDILICSNEQTQPNRVLINLGKGRFNNSSVRDLPLYGDGSIVTNNDFVVDDLDKDGLKDLIVINNSNYTTWNLVVYLQNRDGSFSIRRDWFKYTINQSRHDRWKAFLYYYDFNRDGIKDIGYLDSGSGSITYGTNTLLYKSVFIRSGNEFIEQDYYQYDSFANSLKPRFR